MRIGNEWQAIRRWSISLAGNTAHVTSFFAELTCRVCVVERRFDNCGKRRFRIRKMRKIAHASSTFVRNARRWKPQIYTGETTDHSWTILREASWFAVAQKAREAPNLVCELSKSS